MKRRGPDYTGYRLSQNKKIEMLHVRLAFVDLNNRAVQPFTNRAKGITVAFNGEIYNYQELKRMLSKDYFFETQSDTEVLLAMYATRGLEGLNQLKGFFSGAIVDESLGRVFLFRDAIGKKPLFLANWSDGVYFGSTILALMSASQHKQKIRTEMLPDFWLKGYVSPSKTLFEDCFPCVTGTDY